MGPYLPIVNVYMSLHTGAKTKKLGKHIERGVMPAGDGILPLVYDGPRDVESLWGDGMSEFVDVRPARVGTNKVDRCRPRFNQWLVEAEFVVDTNVIDYEDFCDVARIAGELVGLGDYRLLYGRYEATVEPK